MPKDQLTTLSQQISQSVLLPDALKHALVNALPTLTKEDAATLSTLLNDEEPVLQSIITHSIRTAAQVNDSAFFERLSKILTRARTTMRKTEERAEQLGSDEHTSHLFD